MNKSVSQALFDALSREPGRTAIIDSGEQVTAGNLLQRSASLAEVLSEHSVGAGRNVVFCLQENVDAIIACLATWRLGATPLLLDFRTPGAQRDLISRTVDAAVFVESRRPTGSQAYEGALWDHCWMDRKTAIPAIPDAPLDCSRPAFLTLSSGTTGAPKIYLQSHQAIMTRLLLRIATLGGTGRTFFTPMSISFSASRNMVLGHLLAGRVVILEPPLFSTSELIENLLATKASGCALPPPIIRNLVREIGEREKPFFPDLKILRSIGGPATPDDKIAAYRNLSPGYSISYSSTLVGPSTMLAGKDILRRPETVGRSLDEVTLEIVDRENLRALEPGEAGLIRVKSPWVTDKVIESAAGSDTERHGPGWGIPGDIGFLDENGFLTLAGHEADLIVRGGVSVAPQEIEALLRLDTRIKDIGVVGIEDLDYGQEIAAFIVAEEGSEKDFHALCMKTIAPDRRPRHIRILRQLPYNTNGKLMRSELAQMLDKG